LVQAQASNTRADDDVALATAPSFTAADAGSTDAQNKAKKPRKEKEAMAGAQSMAQSSSKRRRLDRKGKREEISKLSYPKQLFEALAK